jgi:methionyl-tRNA synthetase
MARFYVTTPIYYVNDLPHIGHVYSSVVADTMARYRRLVGDEVYFLTGTDEHGQKIEEAAREAGVAPLQLADRVVARYHEVYRRVGVATDDFIRTTEERHARGVRELIRRIDAAGDLYVARHEGWYCPKCEAFYTEKELLPGNLCPDHRSAVEWKSEENVFFRLSRYQQPLLDWYAAGSPVRPRSRANEVRAFVEAGLRDLSVSRTSVSWGIPFPGHPGHVTYVWLDALSNYVTALGFGAEGAEAERYERFWAGPGAGERLHLIGKDILRFHAVYWPAFLMSAGVPLPTTVFAHGWWLRDDRKMSKSLGNVARPDELIDSLGADPLRYFLLREMVFGQDASFSDEGVVDRYNGDLANGLGNTLSRLVTLSRRAFEGRTPPAGGARLLEKSATAAARDYRTAMDAFEFHKALEALWRLLADVNQHVVTHEPWKLIKAEAERGRLAAVLWEGLEAVRIVAAGLLPVMPETAARVLRAVGAPVPGPGGLAAAMAWGGLGGGVEIPEPAALFPRADKERYFAAAPGGAAPPAAAAKVGQGAGEGASRGARTAKTDGVSKEHSGMEQTPPSGQDSGHAAVQPSGQQPAAAGPAEVTLDEFLRVELKVVRIEAAEEVPKSSKLVKLTVDLGTERRTVVAGIRKSYAPEQLVGRQVVIVANLKPATLMGIQSQGMVLAASPDGEAVLLHPEHEVPPGTRVR